MKIERKSVSLCLAAALSIFILAGFSVSLRAQSGMAANPFAPLHFRPLGPVGNRAVAIAGEPGNRNVVYIGAASGGIFKTTDGGTTWEPIFDDQDVSAVGALTIAPSDHSVVWAGTGETFLIRPFHAMGDGVYRSADSGKTWKHMGLEETGHIGRIVIDPHDSDTVFVCAVGQAYRPQHERGVFRTHDGGKTWQQILFVDENTGCSDIAMDANSPKTLFAGMWQLDIKTWNLASGGPGSGVYVSRDGGDTWQRLAGRGLPPADHPVGKIGVAIAPSNSNRVYALIQDKPNPGFYRSDDGGRTWMLASKNQGFDERPSYYTRFAVSPDDENLIYFVSVAFEVSRDGGDTIAKHFIAAGGDNHDIWIDPTNAGRILVANDQGGSISVDHGATYDHISLPIAQIYHVYTDNQIPYNVFGNRQDGGSYGGPSNSIGGGFTGGGAFPGASTLSPAEWRSVGGCESGFAIPDPVDNYIIWSGCYNGDLDRTDWRSEQIRNVSVWPVGTYGFAPADVKYRWHWTFPVAISPFDHNKVYVGSQFVHVTTNGGQSWSVVSPDLTLNDKSHEQSSGGISPDNLMTFDGATLYSIAESPVEKGLIWTGSNDGQVNLTRDGGKTWSNVTKNITGLPPWGTVFNIEPSKYDAGAAYITVDLQQVGDYNAYVYKTSDYGQTWKNIGTTIPKSTSSFAHCVREDPVRKGMLYLGTDNALYVSWDDGNSWTHLRNNLPPAPVYWVTIQPQFNDLVIATHGRGIYILDDVSSLRNYDKAQGDAYLFKPRPAYRWRTVNAGRTGGGGTQHEVAGQNPPYGADIDFYLKSPAREVRLTFLGADGKVIREITQPGRAGLNRVWWDLRYNPTMAVKLLTQPSKGGWAQFGDDGTRPLVSWSRAAFAPRIAPGNYTVKLTIGDKDYTQPLEILRDPHTIGSPQDIEADSRFELQVAQEANDVAAMINHAEWTRKQIQDAAKMLEADPKNAALAKAAHDLDAKAMAAEDQMFDTSLLGRGEDSFRAPMGLYEQLGNLFTVASTSADLPPTDQAIEVNKMYQGQIEAARRAWKELGDGPVAAFNRQLKDARLTIQIEP